MNVPLSNSIPESVLTPLVASTETTRPSVASVAFKPDVLRSVKMHPVLASSVASITFVLLLLYSLTMKPVYEAEAVISEKPELLRLFGENITTSFDSAGYDSFLQEQIQTMQRPDTIAAALNKLPRSIWSEYGLSERVAVDGVLAQIKVGRVTTSYQVRLTLKGLNPKNIASIVNEIATTYLDMMHKQAQAERDMHTKMLAQEREQIESELRVAQKEQGALETIVGMGNPDGGSSSYNGELASIRVQLLQARSAHDIAAARLASVSGQPKGHGSALAAMANEVLVSDAGLSALKASISERRTVLNAQMSGMTYENPLRQRGQEELALLDRSLDEATAKLRLRVERDLQDKLQADLQQTGYVEEQIKEQLSQRMIVATNAIPKLQRAMEINSNLKRLLNRQSEIDDTTRSLQIERSDAATAHLFIVAQIPLSPETNHQHVIIISSLPLALLLGMATAVIARKLDPKIYTAVDVENLLGFAPLAVLNAFNEISMEDVAEDVLRMTGGIENAYSFHGIHNFLFTTATTNTSIEPLCRVLLEKLSYTGISACRTTSANLLLPSKTVPIDNAEFLTYSEADSRLPLSIRPSFATANLALLHEHHGLVLIEASTLMNSAETEYVARCASATILVVESATTTKLELVQAAALLKRIGVSTVGVVVQGLRKHYDTGRRSKPFSAPSRIRAHDEAFHRQSESLLDQSEASVSASLKKRDAGIEPRISQVNSEPDIRTTASTVSGWAATPHGDGLPADSKELEDLQPIESGPNSSNNNVIQREPFCHSVISNSLNHGPELDCNHAQINMVKSSVLWPNLTGYDPSKKHMLETHMNVEHSEYVLEPKTFLPILPAADFTEERHTYFKQSDLNILSILQVETSHLPTSLHSINSQKLDEELLGSNVHSEPIRHQKVQDSSEIKQSEHPGDRVGMLTRRWCLLSRFQQENEAFIKFKHLAEAKPR